MPAYQPSELPPDDAVYTGQSEQESLAELLSLTWEFFSQASPAAREELRAFLTSRGYHPKACLGWFLDGLQFSASQLTETTAAPSQDPSPGN